MVTDMEEIERIQAGGFDMGWLEMESDPMMSQQLKAQAAMYEVLVAGEKKDSMKKLAAEMFEGREWSWDNA
jgi:hypothetical protein